MISIIPTTLPIRKMPKPCESPLTPLADDGGRPFGPCAFLHDLLTLLSSGPLAGTDSVVEQSSSLPKGSMQIRRSLTALVGLISLLAFLPPMALADLIVVSPCTELCPPDQELLSTGAFSICSTSSQIFVKPGGYLNQGDVRTCQ